MTTRILPRKGAGSWAYPLIISIAGIFGLFIVPFVLFVIGQVNGFRLDGTEPRDAASTIKLNAIALTIQVCVSVLLVISFGVRCGLRRQRLADSIWGVLAVVVGLSALSVIFLLRR